MEEREENYCSAQSESQKDQHFLSSKRGPISKYISGLGTNKNTVMGPDGTGFRVDYAGEC
jgi:NAD(P)H-flavin reductase